MAIKKSPKSLEHEYQDKIDFVFGELLKRIEVKLKNGDLPENDINSLYAFTKFLETNNRIIEDLNK